jgi:hypothetical protein
MLTLCVFILFGKVCFCIYISSNLREVPVMVGDLSNKSVINYGDFHFV